MLHESVLNDLRLLLQAYDSAQTPEMVLCVNEAIEKFIQKLQVPVTQVPKPTDFEIQVAKSEVALVYSGERDFYSGKFEAIKLFRNRTGLGLKESKEAIERYL